MRIFTIFAICIFASSASASTGTDSVAGCRAAFADDPPAHIACLESALNKQNATDPSVEPKTNQPTGLGSEELIQQEKIKSNAPAEQAAALIVGATYNAQGLGVFKLSDGQVWRETVPSPSHQHLEPGQEYQARIETAMFGGYRMYVDGVKRMLKVERVK